MLQDFSILAAVPTFSRKAICDICPSPFTAPNEDTVRWQHTSVGGRRHTVKF